MYVHKINDKHMVKKDDCAVLQIKDDKWDDSAVCCDSLYPVNFR